LGLVTAQLEAQSEEAERLRERMVTAYQDAQLAGEDYLSTAHIIKDTQDLMYNEDRAAEYQRVLDTQKQTGLDMNTLFKANAGDLEAIRVVQSRITGLVQDEMDANFEKTGMAFQY